MKGAPIYRYTMSLDIVLGPMWAGKSSYIIGKIRRYRAIGWDVFVVTNPLDNRYGSQVVSSHDKEQVSAHAVSELTTLYEDPLYTKAKLLVIEEAQFYKGLYNFVKRAVEEDGKHVVCVGLDGDANRKPFGEILSLIPLCDTLEKIKSLCSECKDGTPALFTHRFVTLRDGTPVAAVTAQAQTQINVGGEDSYAPLCRKHFLANNV